MAVTEKFTASGLLRLIQVPVLILTVPDTVQAPSAPVPYSKPVAVMTVEPVPSCLSEASVLIITAPFEEGHEALLSAFCSCIATVETDTLSPEAVRFAENVSLLN